MAKQRKSKEREEIYKIVISCVLILLLVLIVGLIFRHVSLKKEISANVIESEIENPSFYDEDSCRCVERERFRCLNDFELDVEQRICRNGNEITNVILGCSKYECSGVNYNFNFENKQWEKQ